MLAGDEAAAGESNHVGDEATEQPADESEEPTEEKKKTKVSVKGVGSRSIKGQGQIIILVSSSTLLSPSRVLLTVVEMT